MPGPKTRLFGSRSTQSLAVTLALLVLLSAVSFSAIRRFLRNSAQSARTERVLETLASTLSHLKDAETGQRGYLLTGEPSYLEPYNAAAGAVSRDIAALRRLGRQRRRVDDLAALTAAKRVELGETIALRKRGHTADALRVVATGRGKALMDRIRALEEEMARDERRGLRRQTEAAEAAGRTALLILAVGGALGIGLIAAATALVYRDIEARREAEARLADALQYQRRIADALQEAFLIAPPEDAFGGISVATFYEAAWDEALIGGDFFDAFALAADRVALVVGDASGKGLAAASRTTEVKYALRAFLRESPNPAGALSRLNDFVCGARVLEQREVTFVVLALAVVDTRTGETIFAAAGAEPPLVLRAAGGVAETIEAVGGLPLGIEPDQAYPTVTTALAPGDVILMATDGITEARQAHAEFLGPAGMARLAESAWSQDPENPPLRRIGQAVLDGARAFTGGTLQDDACLLLARRKPLDEPVASARRGGTAERTPVAILTTSAVNFFTASR